MRSVAHKNPSSFDCHLIDTNVTPLVILHVRTVMSVIPNTESLGVIPLDILSLEVGVGNGMIVDTPLSHASKSRRTQTSR